jgi:hypothetical protein
MAASGYPADEQLEIIHEAHRQFDLWVFDGGLL